MSDALNDANLGGDYDEDLNDQDFGNEDGLDDAGSETGSSGVAEHSSGSDQQDEPREDEPSVKQTSRSQARVEEATRRTRAAEADATELRQRLANMEANQTRATEEARERQALDQMNPYERAEHVARSEARKNTNEIAQLRHDMADANDRAAFAAACAGNPALARVQDDVEKQLAESRRNGVTIERKQLAAYLIGQRIMDRAPAARAKQVKSASANIDRERGRPVSGGSDSPGGRAKGDDAASRRARLTGQTI